MSSSLQDGGQAQEPPSRMAYESQRRFGEEHEVVHAGPAPKFDGETGELLDAKPYERPRTHSKGMLANPVVQEWTSAARTPTEGERKGEKESHVVDAGPAPSAARAEGDGPAKEEDYQGS